MSGLGHNQKGPSGWLRIERDILDHYLVGAGQPVKPHKPDKPTYSRLEAWLYLLTKATRSERKVVNRGITQVLEPGATLAGRDHLAEVWNWSNNQVRGFLKKLELELMITLYCQKSTSKRTNTTNVAQITNWPKYQEVNGVLPAAVNHQEHQLNHQQTTTEPPANHQQTTRPRQLTPNKDSHTLSAREPVVSNPERSLPPHMNGVGFVVSKAWDISIPHEIIQRWRTDYPNIPNLEVELRALAVSFVGSSTACQRYRDCPEHWFERILAKENAKVAPDRGKGRKGSVSAMRKLLETKQKTGDADGR